MQLFRLALLLLIFNFIQIFTAKKSSNQDSDSDENHNFLIDRVAKYLPDNFLQDGINILKNVISNNFDISKPFECEFRCPNGKKPKKIAGKEKKVAQNGCGAYDYHFDFDLIKLSGFNDCCNEHDICYGTCNTPKIECDNQFKECLFARCVKLAQKNTLIKSYEDICKEAAQVLYASVMKLGCPAYGKAQKQECVC